MTKRKLEVIAGKDEQRENKRVKLMDSISDEIEIEKTESTEGTESTDKTDSEEGVDLILIQEEKEPFAIQLENMENHVSEEEVGEEWSLNHVPTFEDFIAYDTARRFGTDTPFKKTAAKIGVAMSFTPVKKPTALPSQDNARTARRGLFFDNAEQPNHDLLKPMEFTFKK